MTYEERKGALERRHLTSSALIKEVLRNQATQLFQILGDTGYYFGGKVVGAKVTEETVDDKGNADTYTLSALVVPWGKSETRLHGKMVFKNIRKGGAPFLERDLPEERDREAQDAFSMTVDNRGDKDIVREVTRNVAVGTSEAKTKQDKINWDVKVGFEFSTGKRGTEATFGVESLGTFSTSFGLGGEHTTGKEEGKTETLTRAVDDTFTIPGKSKYKIVGTCDKITMEQKYRIYYPIDYDVEIFRRDFGVSKYDIYNKWYSNGDKMMTFCGIDDIISSYLGYPMLVQDDFNREKIGTNLDEQQGLIGQLERISDKNNRMIVQHGTITYNDASDISVGTWMLGTYDDKGELIL